MSDNKHAGRGGKGYYIALILCAAAIGITSYVYYRNANRVEEVSIQESVGEDILVGTMEAEDVPALATQPQTQSTPPATQGTTPAPTAKKPLPQTAVTPTTPRANPKAPTTWRTVTAATPPPP